MQVVVDRPDIVRCVCNLKRLAVTDLKVDVQRLAKKKELAAAFDGAHSDCLSCSWTQCCASHVLYRTAVTG